jgi:hypothetical protein
VGLYLTSIAADNEIARRFLERGLPEMPTYRPLEGFVTSVFAPRRKFLKRPPDLRIEKCDETQLEDVIECLERNGRRQQFTPVWRATELMAHVRSGDLRLITARRSGRVVGCVGVWDQSAYKQAVVRGYAPRLMRWRKWINASGRLLNLPHLPPVRTALNLKYLSQLAVDDDDPEVFAALLDLPDERSVDARFVLGLSARHPLLGTIPKSLRRFTYRTNLYAVHWPDGRAAAEALDGRVCQPEVALL